MGGVESDTLYGTLNLLVLRALRGGPLHGLGVIRLIAQEAEGALRVEEGALYPALHRLERDGLVEGEWGRTPENRRAKFYRLTRNGRRHLERETERWSRHTELVGRLLATRPTAAE